MSRRSLRLLVLISVAAGLVAGAVAAVAVPRHAAAPGVPRLGVKRVAAPLKTPSGQLDMKVDNNPAVRVVATAPDPAGGPDWAIRTFDGTYAFPTDIPRKHIGKELLGTKACAELGRIVDGRFGWLDGAGTFRPTPAGRQVGPRRCNAVGKARDDGDDAAPVTWVSHPEFGEPQPLATLVWGKVPASDTTISVTTTGGGAADVHRGDDGAFLAFLAPSGRAPEGLRVTSVDAAGKSRRLYHPIGVPHRIKLTTASRLMARAPDPEGGASWGVAAGRTRDGLWCSTNPGRVVGDGVGMLDARLDLFSDQTGLAYACQPPPAQASRFRVLTRKRPLMYTSTSGGGPSSYERPGGDAGRVALRTDPGVTAFAGTTRADVKTITVITPTQTRTIRPSGSAHAFAIAFAGSFPSGKIRFVVTFTDNTTVEQDDRTDDLA